MFCMFRGPVVAIKVLGVGKLCVNRLVSMYLNEHDVDRALNFLLGLDWHTEGQLCLTQLQQITNYLFRLPFTPVREGNFCTGSLGKSSSAQNPDLGPLPLSSLKSATVRNSMVGNENILTFRHFYSAIAIGHRQLLSTHRTVKRRRQTRIF